MVGLQEALGGIDPQRLQGMRRGLEKESLRALPGGRVALTPHPKALGSALTHPHITTDFSESQLELITGVHADAQSCVDELDAVSRFVAQNLDEEMMWVSSMPCGLPADDDIPLGQYGTSNVGRSKTVYRRGLGYRYGRRMQTISGIHYNWSLPGVSSAEYFALIRNFRRHAFLLMYLFGASPAVCSTFVAGRNHALQPLSEHTLYLPYATSLRMGRLGYQSEAQASLAVSYNNLEGYGRTLEAALTQPYAAYEAIGMRSPDGTYRQLNTHLLQIENEFYGTIRPKRVIRSGERPLHALRERGVEYVEVRLMDLDPFETVGINTRTMQFLDVFLLHCLRSPSADDTPAEIMALGRNQHLVAERGREPGLQLERGDGKVTLTDWGRELVAQMVPIAQAMDAALGTDAYGQAVSHAQRLLDHPEETPSARVLQAITEQHAGSFVGFVRAQSRAIHAELLSRPLDAAQQEAFVRESAESVAEQARIEAADTMDFDRYLAQYLSHDKLVV
ncbi:glutamate--cysteine ligase [Curvibacter sp. APW13]|uniref:glutamate--cysteine ligase n=1 Tax=Curvibacter sp. APW13 TaxID=3077236 RepID=UPI0028DD4102|nr:glutamate--cysteine ligase [Curvibacter sp. APW13]MDT8991943.1 glutamate--cysteine ligase [Curvibacter sp. APW13]